MLSSKLKKFSLSTFLIEVFTIIFGVLLALGVNEVRNHYNDKQEVNIALESIKVELNNNKAFLDLRLPYYESMIDTIKKVISLKGKDIGFKSVSLPGFKGINPPLLRNSSLRTAISTQAFSNMEYSMANKISWVYSFQETYLKWVYIYFEAFFQSDNATLEILILIFQEMSFVGKQIYQEYEQLLDVL